MKNYNFKIVIDKDKRESNLLIKKSFNLRLKNKVDDYDMWSEVVYYLNENVNKHFSLHGEESFSFKIKRGVNEITCNLYHEECCSCGGNTEIDWDESGF